jgi:hypothetical protein
MTAQIAPDRALHAPGVQNADLAGLEILHVFVMRQRAGVKGADADRIGPAKQSLAGSARKETPALTVNATVFQGVRQHRTRRRF